MTKTVKMIYEYLDSFVEGQKEAKKMLAYLGHIHLKRMEYKTTSDVGLTKDQLKNLILRVDDRIYATNIQLNEEAAYLDYNLDEDTRNYCEGQIVELKQVLRNLQDQKEMYEHELSGLMTLAAAKEIKKSNGLLLGPSGCGKTYLVRRLAEILSLPMQTIDATMITAAGWEGHSMEDYIKTYFDKYRGHPMVNYGIIFIDEFDKICMPALGSSGVDHNKNTQYNLLKVVEGDILTVKDGHDLRPMMTDNLLFIFAGNFEYMRKGKELQSKESIGFTNTNQVKPLDIHAELQKFNVAQELIGRISLVSEIEQLSKEQLRKILLEGKNGVYEQYRNFIEDCNLSDEEVDNMIDECYNKKVGARGLHTALDKVLLKRMTKDLT